MARQSPKRRGERLRLTLDANWLSAQLPDLTDLHPLASGGFKSVFSASHVTHGEVVVKIIQSGQDLETIRRELLAVNRVDSDRVPDILDVSSLDVPNVGECVLFLEQRVSGSTVREMLADGVLSDEELLKLGIQTLEVLVKSEAVRIVHRDVKPENIMRDQNGEYWLLDFGIARHLTLDSQTGTGQPFGKCTIGYAPPEQMRNIKRDIDPRADLFALGVTLHECATGVNPFRHGAQNELEMIARVEHTVLPRLSLTIQSCSDFADLIETMTQKRRHHRPSTITEAYTWMKDICSQERIV